MLGKCLSCCLIERTQRCLDWTRETWPIKALRRVLPLLNAIWMIFDLGSDVNQTIFYYVLINGFNVDGVYRDWALIYKNKMGSDHLQEVSAGYFYSACAVWIIPPVLATFIGFHHEFLSFPIIFQALFRCNIDIDKTRINWFIFYPLELTSCILWIYIIIPYAAMKNGFKHLFNDKVDEEEDLILGINPKWLPNVKLIEIFGEALPQFILTAVFASNNLAFLLEFDSYYNIPIPGTIVSLIFSLGSIFIGFKSGYQPWSQSKSRLNAIKEVDIKNLIV